MRFQALVLFSVIASFFSCQAPVQAQDVVKDIPAQLKKEPGQIVDVRTLDEWNEGHYKSAIHADWLSDDFKNKAAKWDKNKTYYLYCAAGGRSSKATQYLKTQGFKKVYNLGGYDRLKDLK